MSTVVVDDVELDIPSWVTDLNSFRRWLDDPQFPEKLPVWWLRGKVWADMSKEQLFSHNLVRTKITSALDRLVEDDDLGVLWGDGVFLANPDCDIAGNPDAVFASHDTIAAGRVTLTEGSADGFVEVHGTPDMVLEVVSRSSVKKDTQVLFDAYWEAGIAEYWLVDARRAPLSFDIWKHSAKGYVTTRKRDGWVRSNVFSKSFRLSSKTDRSGLPTYRLEVR
ncbi:MAG TPA: Uma2 family endonuclease [Gemmataceae bacterium]|nr:Uma2 family endonuclease [Gemmataceae bacterium]